MTRDSSLLESSLKTDAHWATITSRKNRRCIWFWGFGEAGESEDQLWRVHLCALFWMSLYFLLLHVILKYMFETSRVAVCFPAEVWRFGSCWEWRIEKNSRSCRVSPYCAVGTGLHKYRWKAQSSLHFILCLNANKTWLVYPLKVTVVAEWASLSSNNWVDPRPCAFLPVLPDCWSFLCKTQMFQVVFCQTLHKNPQHMAWEWLSDLAKRALEIHPSRGFLLFHSNLHNNHPGIHIEVDGRRYSQLLTRAKNMGTPYNCTRSCPFDVRLSLVASQRKFHAVVTQ